ncbi:MAG TPA: tRNA lysidine(34) synthetase TilS [Gemmatimonadales bacterium]|nr:tRNA lysidine(34) synthetase TilS [Gemmatimonadales bacterium]
MPTLAERFLQRLDRRRLLAGPGTALVAVSGGADSVALLDLLAGVAERRNLRLIVAHVDHGIQEGSAGIAEQVRGLAGRYGFPFERAQLELGSGASETVARRARYAWLEDTRRRRGAEWIVTAHHQDDQVETVLLRALRGSAPAGLAGMASRSRGGIIRPLLGFTHSELVAHANERGLDFHDDPANEDPRHLRSWLRRDLLPALEGRLGKQLRGDLLRLGRAAAVDRRAWDGVLNRLPGLDLKHDATGFDVARGTLRGYDDPLGATVLRAAARRAGLVLGPSRARQVLALAGRPSGRRLAIGNGWEAAVVFDRLRLERPRDREAMPVVVTRGARGDARFGRFVVRWAPATAPKQLSRTAWRTWIRAGAWTVRGARPGDVIAPLRGVGHRELRRVFMDARVPRGARPNYPVLVRGETILWVPGICRGADAVPRPGTRAVRVDVTEH